MLILATGKRKRGRRESIPHSVKPGWDCATLMESSLISIRSHCPLWHPPPWKYYNGILLSFLCSRESPWWTVYGMLSVCYSVPEGAIFCILHLLREHLPDVSVLCCKAPAGGSRLLCHPHCTGCSWPHCSSPWAYGSVFQMPQNLTVLRINTEHLLPYGGTRERVLAHFSYVLHDLLELAVL